MPFIGNKPSAVPLTSADIADGIITSAKIVDGTIVNSDISTTSAITLNKLSGNPSFRNIVINGDMQVAQRNTSVASITASGYYTVDRFQTFLNTLGTWTQSQSTDVPSGYGFANSFKMDCTSADASPASDDLLIVAQKFEGQNLQYLKKGTANALPLTASFWVKSTKTGTFIVELYDIDNNRQISKSYTVNTTNTWEFKTVTFAGDTTGAFDNNNGHSLSLQFWLGAGSDHTSGTLNTSWGTATTANRVVGQVNCADSTSNDWLITGIQLEAGTSATDFESLPIDVSLDRCLRYYYLYQSGNSTSLGAGSYYASNTFSMTIDFSKPMRTPPSLVQGSGTNYYTIDNSAGLDYFDSFSGTVYSSVNNITIFNNTQVSGTRADSHLVLTNDAGSSVAFNAEL
jgi:hypothetical protein